MMTASLALAMAASACGGWELNSDEESKLNATDHESQALLFQRPSIGDPLEVAEPDLVGEILSCGYDTVTVSIRNEGNIATHARSCSWIGPYRFCTPNFKTEVFTGESIQRVWLYDLDPGEEAIEVLPKPAGWEGHIWMSIDTWGSGSHSVVESDEYNNYSETFCVM